MSLQKTLLLLLLLTGTTPAGTPPFAKSETAETWSLKQMQHMLADRPVMKTYRVGRQICWVRRQDSIWQWVAEHYAGKTTGIWTAWHEAPPIGADAMHAYGEDKAYVYVKDIPAGQADEHNAAFERLWSRAVFELLNMENVTGFQNATQAALDGTLTRREFAGTYARLEHRALGRLQQFYHDIWLPWCKAQGLASDATIWEHGYIPDADTWLAQYPADSRYPWEEYGEGYDRLRQEAKPKNAEKKSAGSP